MKNLILVLTLAFAASAHADFGRIKWFSLSKDFGFIIPDNGDNQIFFQGKYLLNPDEASDLYEGKCVTYTPVLDRSMRMHAKEVRLADCP